MCLFVVALLEGDLSEVEALRDVKAELISKKEVSCHRYFTKSKNNITEFSSIRK